MASGYQTKAQLAALALRGMIRSGELAPGQRVDLDALAASMNMSATPIREAMRSIEAEGLITSEPYRGIRVVDFSADDAAAIYNLRALLESHAAELAGQFFSEPDLSELARLADLQRDSVRLGDVALTDQRNQDWHFFIYRVAAAHSPYLLEFISRLWHAFPWTTAWMVPGRVERSMNDHDEIMKAFLDRDGHAASASMRKHILAGKEFVIERLLSAGNREHGT